MASSDGGSETDPAPEPVDVRNPLASRLLVAFRSFDRRAMTAVALLGSGVPFVTSAAIATLAGFGAAFVTSGPVYLWTGGLFGGGLTLGWWAKRYPELWSALEQVFDATEPEYRAVVRPRLAEMYDLRRSLLWVPVALVPGVLYDAIAQITVLIYIPEAVPQPPFSPADPRVACLPVDVCLTWLGVVNYVFGIVSLAGFVVAIHLVVNHLRLVSDVMELGLRDVRTAAADLVPLARFNIAISVGWFISLTLGTALLGIGIIELGSSPLVSAGFVFALLFGFVLFAVPQYSIHRGLAAGKRALLEGIDAEYEALYEDVAALDDAAAAAETASVQFDLLEARRRNTKEIRTWAYDLPGVVSLLASSVVPLLPQVVQVVGSL